MPRRRRSSIQNKAKATFEDATACLPRDVLAAILLRLPASDLRRFRRVCKDWREVISDPAFIDEHMNHGPQALTHTIVFFPGSSPAYGAEFPGRIRDFDAKRPEDNCHGFLYDKDWRLVATFTAGESEEMVGTCNGLLCFLDVRESAINIVEPFTGESLAVPLPPKTERLLEAGAYCFGFDPGSRRYKIFHLGLNCQWDNTPEQDLYVYTIGGGENWRRVHIASTAGVSVSYSDPMLADGSLYWSVHTDHQLAKLARFDLATEEITSTPFFDFLPVLEDQCTAFEPMTDSDARLCVMTVERRGHWNVFFMADGGRWTRDSCSDVTLPRGRCLTSPQALQRGHLLLQDNRDDGGLYAHPIPAARNKMLLKIGKGKEKEPAKSDKRGLFVPALLNQVPEMAERVPHKWSGVGTFCYAPPVSPAPLAQRFAFPCGSPQPLGENK